MRSTLAKLSLCRTAALGGHRFRCRSCDHETTLHNSCGDRHCPQCAGAKRRDWLESASALLLPGIDYYQVVFTIPDRLSSLTLGNRRVMFALLFHSAWRALKQTIEDEQQFEAAAAMMLHTWNQKLESHVHVHVLVPGGGPSLKTPGTWKTTVPPGQERANRFWLVDADALRLAFRTQFLKGLRSLHRRGKLKLEGEWFRLKSVAAFETWLEPLENVSWVTYIQAPPSKNSSPEHVLKYLARYMTGGPISDRRLTDHKDNHVTFTARTGTQTGGSDETEPVTLRGSEFVRRWSLHILPKGFTKTRRFGGWSNHHCKRYLRECRNQLPTGADTEAARASETTSDRRTEQRCPHCESLMTCVSSTDAPSWKHVLRSRFRPHWYDDD